MDILSNMTEMSDAVNENLSNALFTSNEQVEALNTSTQQTINLNGSYIFDDDESINYLMNRIGLAVQRQGGK